MGRIILIGMCGMEFHTAVASLLAEKGAHVDIIPVPDDLERTLGVKYPAEELGEIISVETDGRSPYQALVDEGVMPPLEAPIHNIAQIINEMTLSTYVPNDPAIVTSKKAKVIPFNADCRKVRTKKPFNKKLARNYTKRG